MINSEDHNSEYSYDHENSFYCTSVCYGPLSNPGYFDYMHLVFWFYYLTTIIVAVWLLFTFIVFLKNSKKKKPVIETRGFSRAQTGDSITAVIPMTWSITMLMHASTNSSNFDENVDSTVFTLTVIAYQWGWNYFYPKDTLLGDFEDPSYYDLFKLTNDDVNLSKKQNEKNIRLLSQIKLENLVIHYASEGSGKIDPSLIIKSRFRSTESLFIGLYQYGCGAIMITPSNTLDLSGLWSDDCNFQEITSTRKNPSGQIFYDSNVLKTNNRLSINSGIVLPSDTNIHIVCGSKDVIHSWAIPGLFLKIDCIPGYNCHRRILLKWQGLYWGQCMEVCGRYHHWMPILIRVSSYELFIVWLKSFCL